MAVFNDREFVKLPPVEFRFMKELIQICEDEYDSCVKESIYGKQLAQFISDMKDSANA